MIKSLFLFIFKGLGAILSLCLGVIISRFYGIETFGKYGILLTYVTFFSILSAWGVNILIVEKNTKFINCGTIFFWFICSVLFLFLFYLFILKLNYPYYLSLLCIFLSFSMLKGAYFMISGKQYLNAFIDDFLKYFVPILVIFFSVKVFDYYEFYSSYFLSCLFVFLFSLIFFLKNSFIKIDDKNIEILESFKYGLFPTFSALLILLSAQFDRVLLSYILSEKDVGIYFMAQSFIGLVTYANLSIMMVITPKLVKLYKEKNYYVLHRIVKKYSILIILFTIFILILAIFFGNIFMSFYGIESQQGYACIIIILASLLFSHIFGFGLTISMYNDKKKKLVKYQLLTFILCIPLCYLLTINFGIIGAAISTSIGIILLKFLIWLDYKRERIPTAII